MAELQTMIELTKELQHVRALRRLSDTKHDDRVKLTARQDELAKLVAQSTERWLISQELVE